MGDKIKVYFSTLDFNLASSWNAFADEGFDIEKDKVWNFYWIGLKKEHSDEFYSQLAEKALEELNKSSSNGESLIVESENVRILAVKCNSLYAGKEIPFADYSVDENEGENEGENEEN